jgi:glycosyltransferase involved in cell wall biosynthesis
LTSHLYLAPLRLTQPFIKGRVIAMDLNFMLRPITEDNIQFRLGNAVIRNVAASPRSRVVSISPEMTQGLLARKFNPATIEEISNGVSTDFFKPQADAKASVKDELALNHVQHLIGIASRHGPSPNETYKDVPSFVHAMAELKHLDPELYRQCGFIACGFGTDRGDLQQLAAELGVSENLRVLGPRNDMPRQYSAWDISNICSITEPFGLVVPEAMACETPCVVTNASLFPEMVGDTGRVVPVRQPALRAAAWQDLLNLPEDQFQAMGREARARVQERYSHTAMVGKYVELYQDLTDSTQKLRLG